MLASHLIRQLEQSLDNAETSCKIVKFHIIMNKNNLVNESKSPKVDTVETLP